MQNLLKKINEYIWSFIKNAAAERSAQLTECGKRPWGYCWWVLKDSETGERVRIIIERYRE